MAGTDPFDRRSVLATQLGAASAFVIQSVPGMRYQLWSSPDMITWKALEEMVIADSPETTFEIDLQALLLTGQQFLRASVSEVDRDGDGLDDALEFYLGFDPTNASSVRAVANGGDLEHFVRLIEGGNSGAGSFGSSDSGIPSQEHASRFLAQATFGPTMDKIASLKLLGLGAYEAWIDNQPSYNNRDIEHLARVFTGLDFQKRTGGRTGYATAPVS